MSLKNYFLFCLLALSSLFVYGNATEEERLRKIQRQITQKENSLSKTKQEVEKWHRTLKEQNDQIQVIESELKKISSVLLESKKLSKKNEKKISSLKQEMQIEKDKLKKQIELAFKQGQSSSLEMLFANQDTQKNDRIVGYVNYMNREREETIAKIQQQEASIQAKQNEIVTQLKEQEKLVAEEKIKIKALEKVKADYAKTLKALEKEAEQTENQIITLRDDEINLKYQIDRAVKIASKKAESSSNKSLETTSNPKDEQKKTAEPFKSGHAQLTNNSYAWPVNGKVFTRFGESLGGELMSKGMVIEAPITTDVKAIKEGEVLIADYLQGYGQVIVVDHGGDYMSLYGYNNDVLVRPGERVKAGQVISKVGLVEGGYRSALYFEIRHKGEAIDPKKYLSR